MSDTKRYSTAPVVAGGVYRSLVNGREVMGVCLGTRVDIHGKVEGRLFRVGYPECTIREGTESMLGLDLVARPALLEEPIVSDRVEASVQELQDENESLKAELLALRAALRDQE